MCRAFLSAFFIAAFVGLSLSSCKKGDGDSDGGSDDPNLTLSNLRLLHTETSPSGGEIVLMGVEALSVTADGRIHTFTERAIAGKGFSTYWRRTLDATGKRVDSPGISTQVLNVAAANDVHGHWAFAPYTGKLTMWYHPEQTSLHHLYLAEAATPIYTHNNASFGGALRLCTDGSKLLAEGYGGYYSNGPVMHSDAYFFYQSASGVDYNGGLFHSYPSYAVSPSIIPVQEDQQRRAFWMEPGDASYLTAAYADGNFFYVQRYNLASRAWEARDSIATTVLKPLTRVIHADAGMRGRTTPDGTKIVYLLRYLSGAFPGDGNYHYSTFIYDKATRKISTGVVDAKLPSSLLAVSADASGNLIYAQPDNMSEQWAWSIYRQAPGGAPQKIASIAQREPTYLSVTGVTEHYGKVYVTAVLPGTTSGSDAKAYVLTVE